MAATTASANRKSDPKQLSRLFRGELDWIVMKALEKDRNRRYESASAFAADVQRYLSDEPVQACPPSAWYRAKKFVRRNKVALTTVALVVVALLLGAGISIWQAVRATSAQIVADASRRHSRKALSMITDESIAYILGRQAQLDERDKKFLRKVERLCVEFARAEGDSEQARRDRLTSFARLGRIRLRLGELQGAETAYREAVALGKQLGDEFSADASMRQKFAGLYLELGVLLQERGQLREAERFNRKAATIYQELVAKYPAETEYRLNLAQADNNWGTLLHEMGRLAEAEAAYGQVLVLLEQLVKNSPKSRDHRHFLAIAQYNRARVRNKMSRAADAEADFRKALALYEQLNADFPDARDFRLALVGVHNLLGQALAMGGHLREAEAAFRTALEGAHHLVAEFPGMADYRFEQARGWQNLGTLLLSTGQGPEGEKAFPAVEKAFRAALIIFRKLAADFPGVPNYRVNLGGTYSRLGAVLDLMKRPADAAAAHRDAVAVHEKLVKEFPLPEYRSGLGQSYLNLGALQLRTHQFQEAEKSFTRAINVFQDLIASNAATPDDAQVLAGALMNLAHLKNQTKQHADARKLLERARTYLQQALDANPANPSYRQSLVAYHTRMCQTLLGLGEHASAVLEAQDLARYGEPLLDFYNAACYFSRSIPLAERDSKLPEAKRRELARQYTNQAMNFLRKAVQAGWKDVAHMKRDPDLDPLRSRADFQRLLADLERGYKKGKPDKNGK
jgi:tetratricopeptide (TPR) repeat protein